MNFYDDANLNLKVKRPIRNGFQNILGNLSLLTLTLLISFQDPRKGGEYMRDETKGERQHP